MQFLKIAITAENLLAGENRLIMDVLDGGIDLVHIRKPSAPVQDIVKLLENIDYRYHSRLKIHDHFDILNDYDLGGVHLNSRNPISPHSAKSISRSCHTLSELKDAAKYDYVTLSPIFDSISKAGYRSAFNLENLKDKIEGKNVIALGGVTPATFDILKEHGFAGAAMLGCVWGDVKEFCRQL